MQGQPAQPVDQLARHALGLVPPVAVSRVAKDGMPQLRKMDPDLMGAARCRPDDEQGHRFPGPLDFVSGHGLFNLPATAPRPGGFLVLARHGGDFVPLGAVNRSLARLDALFVVAGKADLPVADQSELVEREYILQQPPLQCGL